MHDMLLLYDTIHYSQLIAGFQRCQRSLNNLIDILSTRYIVVSLRYYPPPLHTVLRIRLIPEFPGKVDYIGISIRYMQIHISCTILFNHPSLARSWVHDALDPTSLMLCSEYTAIRS